MSELSLESRKDVMKTICVEFKVSGLGSFCLDLEPGTTVRDMKKLAKEECDIEPEHMRLVHNGRELKEADIFESEMAASDSPIQVLFTAGHTALVGGGCQARSGGSTGQPGQPLRGTA